MTLCNLSKFLTVFLKRKFEREVKVVIKGMQSAPKRSGFGLELLHDGPRGSITFQKQAKIGRKKVQT